MGRGVLEGAFLLLEEILDTEESGLSELAARTGLPKATAHRLLDQLVQLGAVERRDGRYRMGVTMFRFGSGWPLGVDLRSTALHPLRQLASALPSATLSVSVPDNGHLMVVGACRGEVNEVMPVRAGSKFAVWEAWQLVQRAAREGDGVVLVPQSPCHNGVAGVGVAVQARPGEAVGVVSALVFDERRVPGMIPAVRHAAQVIGGHLARLRRTAGRA
ncbi:helix-turn-helix domain-containing protein [Kutzneria sp. NPDC052558]|uniref:helix-turn-helix domain-containing protein n=1 Tax=Kutzneria sp. NPDC052558 TaxID=3364121 RepID=UPI0037CB6CBF